MATATTKHLRLTAVLPESVASAQAAGLIYVSDRRPGIRRERAGKGFRYRDPEGHLIRDPDILGHIQALAIPPAWKDVWICPDPRGHLQATGRDERGRKQYRYHPRWRSERDATKYSRMVAFGRSLGVIRARTEADLALPGLPKRKVLAAIVRLLEATLIRVGNDEYVRANGSFGLTTMRDRHARIEGSAVRFAFRGKGGIRHSISLHDRRLARIVRRCQELPGQELFQYVDEEGQVQDIGSADVNAYLRELTGEDFTAKDFRTWAGTVLAALALQEYESFDTQARAKSNIVRAIEAVAERLGNTPSVCRKCYVHPAILEAYLDGTLIETLQQRLDAEFAELPHLRPEEAAVLALLQRRLALEAEETNRKREKGLPVLPRSR
ncbi:MAG: DNA topoisomerase IB [Isosphaeraceae bacterium]|nr:DNA topoisomerase IB [Isosphaeraceae bacterium]